MTKTISNTAFFGLYIGLLSGCGGLVETSCDNPSCVPMLIDADLDGIVDANDLCPQTLPGIAVDAQGCEPQKPAPRSIFFIGNSFTYRGTPVPDLVSEMATYSGFPGVKIQFRAIDSYTLRLHKNDTTAEGAPARLREGWDALVLQDQSERPTDSGNPSGFYADATWFYDLALSVNPQSQVYLYETWAWRFDSGLFPAPYATPKQMQDELHYHYFEAANTYIPQHSNTPVTDNLQVAPVGDAWALDLENGEADGRLHDADSHHASDLGRYLNALVIYATIFDRSPMGMTPLLNLSSSDTKHLQEIAQAVTHKSWVGPWGHKPAPIAAGSEFLIDIGPEKAQGWYSLQRRETATQLNSRTNTPSSISVTVWGFTGEQTGGATTNSLNLPELVSRDSLWVGSSASHTDALNEEGRVLIRGLPAGNYQLEIFGSRAGDSAGLGRVTRYSIGAQSADLDTADNTGQVVKLNATPNSNNAIVLKVTVSPNSSSKFGYLNSIRLIKLD